MSNKNEVVPHHSAGRVMTQSASAPRSCASLGIHCSLSIQEDRNVGQVIIAFRPRFTAYLLDIMADSLCKRSSAADLRLDGGNAGERESRMHLRDP